MSDNLQRMLQLVGEVFDTKNDPGQISVSDEERERLYAIHPATLTEYVEGDGPVAWLMGIPTTTAIMQQFINGDITEKELLNNTPTGVKYEALYLGSASILPEYQRKGLAKKLAMEVINKIRQDNPIKALFTWSFSDAGHALSEALAKSANLPIYERKVSKALPEQK